MDGESGGGWWGWWGRTVRRERVSVNLAGQGSYLVSYLGPAMVLEGIWRVWVFVRWGCMYVCVCRDSQTGRERQKGWTQKWNIHSSPKDLVNRAGLGDWCNVNVTSAPLFPSSTATAHYYPLFSVWWFSSHGASLASPGSLLHTLLSFKCFLILSLHFPLLDFTPLSPSDTPCITLINQSLLTLYHFGGLEPYLLGGGVDWRTNGKMRKKTLGKMPSGCAAWSSLKVEGFLILLFHKS